MPEPQAPSPITLYSSFNGATLARRAGAQGMPMVARSLETAGAGAEDRGPALVWATAEAAVPAFRAALDFEPGAERRLDGDLDRFADWLLTLADGRSELWVASLVPGMAAHGLGQLDLTHPQGLARLLMRLNLALADRLAGAPGIGLLDASRWLAAGGPDARPAKPWYVAKIAFADTVLDAALSDLRAARQGRAGHARKLIVCDLDDTLWGGVLGETGVAGLRLGGHDHIGEIHRDIQRALKAWSRTGIQLAVLSKNDEAHALEAIDGHPEMVIRRADLAGWRIGWQDKPTALISLLEELRLGPESTVFLDDNPAERAEMRAALPGVAVPELPADRAVWPGLVRSLDLFDRPSLTAEDRARTEMYAAERARSAAQSEIGSREEWLATLGLEIKAAPLTAADRLRVLQLFNKTNQMNLATRRFDEAGLDQWLSGPGCELWTFRAADRFGDAGLVGILGLEPEGSVLWIRDYVLSCRVIGRGVEATMLSLALGRAEAAGAEIVRAELVPTPRNGPCRAFFTESSGFMATTTAPDRFERRTEHALAVPAHLSLTVAGTGADAPAEAGARR